MKRLGLLLLLAMPWYSLLYAGGKEISIPVNPAQVDIVRDSFGVPHIFSKTDAGVAYGLGWATCEDDFATLQWGLLAGKGMMGRYMGIDGAKIDYAAQLLRARKLVNACYDTTFSAHFKGIMEAYTAAVNLYAKKHPDEVLVKKAFPACPQDIVTGYVLSFCLMSGVDGPIGDVLNGKIEKPGEQSRGAIGSNGMAFNSSITKDGNVYLDINSHQPLEGPLSWYEVHLCSEEGWNIIGGLFHGTVSVLHGTNENLGWAHTYNDFDLIDVFKLKLNPANKNEYWFDGHWEKLETGKAKLVVNLAKNKKIKFLLPVTKKVWWSKYGATLVTKDGAYSVKLPANEVIGEPEQWFLMNKAKNFTEFRHILDRQQLPRMTIVYADRYDTIFHISNGLVPKRNPAYSWDKLVPGDTSATLWTSFQPESALPQSLNPSCGYVFNTNNSPFECTGATCNPSFHASDPTMGFDMKRTNRSVRMYELMKNYEKIDWNDFLKIKFDCQLPDTIQLVNGVDINALKDLDAGKYPDIADAINNIKTCKKSGDVANKKVTIYLSTFYKIFDRLNDGKGDYVHNTADRERLFVECIRAAKADLLKYFGSIDIALGDVQKLQRGGKELPVAGLPDVIKAAYTHPWKDGKTSMWVGESYIQLVKFTHKGLPQIESVSPYGASNKPGSKHYTDQMELFTHEKRKAMSLDKKYVYAHAETIYHPGIDK